MRGEIQFTIALDLTRDDLHLIQRMLAHYRQSHSASASPDVTAFADQVQILVERSDRAARMMDTKTVDSPAALGAEVVGYPSSPSSFPAPPRGPESECEGSHLIAEDKDE